MQFQPHSLELIKAKSYATCFGKLGHHQVTVRCSPSHRPLINPTPSQTYSFALSSLHGLRVVLVCVCQCDVILPHWCTFPCSSSDWTNVAHYFHFYYIAFRIAHWRRKAIREFQGKEYLALNAIWGGGGEKLTACQQLLQQVGKTEHLTYCAVKRSQSRDSLTLEVRN
jgi:hypothetical protein